MNAQTHAPSVAVVIPTFNRAAYLRDALRSVFDQTMPVDEIVVVDDGSDDDLATVAAEFPKVTFLRQGNQGPSAARNAGIHAARSDYVLCLDSDDVLVPTGIESSLACLAENPGVAFVYGGYQRVDVELRPLGPPRFTAVSRNAYHDLLQNNSVAMIGTVLFDRAKLLGAGGFDPAIRRSEDYDVFLRLARVHPVAGDPALVAWYRMHRANVSERTDQMLASALAIQERNRPGDNDIAGQKAYRRGRRRLAQTFAVGAWRSEPQLPREQKWAERRRMARIAPISSLVAAAWQLPLRHLPRPFVDAARRILRRHGPPLGSVDLGDFARARPVSRHFGYDRGTPIDRYYVEKFLSRHAADITGRVLEVGDNSYSRAFGANVAMQDVLHIDSGHLAATIVGDLSQDGTLPEAVFDCMVLTQTLQFIYDTQATVREIRRGLRPGGVALVTVPGVASVDRGEFADTWFWSFTGIAARRMFAEVFGEDQVEVEAFGNVYAATCFLQGLAVEEVERDWLDRFDASYPMIVTVRARRADW